VTVTTTSDQTVTSLRDDRPLTLTVAEAARQLGVTDETIYRLVAREQAPFKTIRIGRRLLISRRSFEAFLGDDRRVTGCAQGGAACSLPRAQPGYKEAPKRSCWQGSATGRKRTD
jgi:excisionase family DNA binding protein